MWYGVGEYILFVTAVSIVAHSASSRYFYCVIFCSMASSVLNLLHEAWAADWNVNPGWLPPLLFLGTVIALPVVAVVGLPFFLLRRRHLISVK